jgi:hypothetical protein
MELLHPKNKMVVHLDQPIETGHDRHYQHNSHPLPGVSIAGSHGYQSDEARLPGWQSVARQWRYAASKPTIHVGREGSLTSNRTSADKDTLGKRMKRLTLVILALTLASRASASKEGILAFSSFRLESGGIDTLGREYRVR